MDSMEFPERLKGLWAVSEVTQGEKYEEGKIRFKQKKQLKGKNK